jgi:hypothetical protein
MVALKEGTCPCKQLQCGSFNNSLIPGHEVINYHNSPRLCEYAIIRFLSEHTKE